MSYILLSTYSGFMPEASLPILIPVFLSSYINTPPRSQPTVPSCSLSLIDRAISATCCCASLNARGQKPMNGKNLNTSWFPLRNKAKLNFRALWPYSEHRIWEWLSYQLWDLNIWAWVASHCNIGESFLCVLDSKFKCMVLKTNSQLKHPRCQVHSRHENLNF